MMSRLPKKQGSSSPSWQRRCSRLWLLKTTGVEDTASHVTGFGTYNDGPGGVSDGDLAVLLDASSLVPEPASTDLVALCGVTLLRRRRADMACSASKVGSQMAQPHVEYA